MSLEEIRIATPCQASWADMAGNDRKRFCAQCKLHVYNLSTMPRAEAESFIERSEARVPALRSATDGREGVCVRLYRRIDGTVLTQDCPVGLATAARLRLGRFVAGLLAVVSVILWGVAASQSEWRRIALLRPIAEWLAPREHVTMGTMPPPVPRPPPVPHRIEMGEMAAPAQR